jgi:O-antigen/teichoic acid export membrane protein
MISSYYEVTLGFVYRQHLSTMAVSLAFFVNLALNFLLIPPLGILGAAIATLLAFGAQLMFAATAAKRHVPEWQGLRIPWRVILASAIMAIAVRSLDNWIGDRGIEGLALLIFVGAGLYLALAVILKIVPAPVVTAVAGRLAGRWREQAK